MDCLARLIDAAEERLAVADWRGLADDVAAIFDANLAALYTVRETRGPGATLAYDFLMASDPEAVRRYVEAQHYRNRIISEFRLAEMRPVRRRELAPDDVFEQIPFYTGFARQFDIWWMIGYQFLVSPDCVASLVLTRGRAQEDFADDEIQRMVLFGRYLRALLLARLVATGKLDPAARFDVARFTRTPVLQLSADYRVMACNAEFAALPAAVHAGASPASRQAVLPVSRGAWVRPYVEAAFPGRDPHAELARSGSPKLELAAPQGCFQIVPVDAGHDEGHVSYLWFAFENRIHARVREFQTRFALTETEAEILDRLARGMAVRQIAEATGRTYGTVRWHVQNLLSKTGAGSQPRLIAKLYQDVHPC